MRNPNKRLDHDGIPVNDEVVIECTGGHPLAFLYSVIRRGDGRLKPKRAKGALRERPLQEPKDNICQDGGVLS